MSENKDSSVVTRLLSDAQQRPIEASFGQPASPSRTLTPAMAPAPLPRTRAPAGSVAPPLSALATAPGRLAPPALPPRLPTHASAFADDELELVDEDFAEEHAKTTEVDPELIAAVRPLPQPPAAPSALSAPSRRVPTEQAIERGLQEIASHRAQTDDTNPGRRISRPTSAPQLTAEIATASPTPTAMRAPVMQPMGGVIVAPDLMTPAHSRQALRAMPLMASGPASASQAAPVVAATSAPHAAPVAHAGSGVVRQPARMRRATPWIAVGAAALVAGAVGALLAMQVKVPPAGEGAAPAQPPEVAAAATGAGELVEVSLRSSPEGASVELVDGAISRPLGQTPLTTKLPADAALALTFRREGFAPLTQAIHPKTQRDLAVALAPAPDQPADQPADPSAVPLADEPTVLAPALIAPPVQAAMADAAPKPSPRRAAAAARLAASPGGSATATATMPGQGVGRKGLLSLGSKPPCEILINGKRTGLMTPQRDLVLPAGSHKITLVNKEFGIREVFSVQVQAGSERRVVKDLSRHLGRQ